MKHLPWRDVILYGLMWIMFPAFTTWAIATPQWPEEWNWWSAITVVVVLVAATGIYVWVIATKTEGKRLKR